MTLFLTDAERNIFLQLQNKTSMFLQPCFMFLSKNKKIMHQIIHNHVIAPKTKKKKKIMHQTVQSNVIPLLNYSLY